MLGKSIAIVFLAAVILVPVAIVTLWYPVGAVWVTGYVAGIILLPIIGIGTMRAMNALFEDTKAFVAVVVFGFAAIVTSLAAAAYAFMR